MKKRFIFIILMALVVNSYAQLNIIRTNTFGSTPFAEPCVIYRVHDPNAVPGPGEYFTQVDIMFETVHPSDVDYHLFIVDNIIKPQEFGTAEKVKLDQFSNPIGSKQEINSYTIGPLPNTIEEMQNDSNIVRKETTKEVNKGPMLPGGEDIIETVRVPVDPMLMVNDYAGTGQPGFGILFFNIVDVQGLVVVVHLNSGRQFEYSQEGHALVYYSEEVEEVHWVYRLPTSKICHEITCRFYEDGRSLPVNIDEMESLGFRHGKCCY